MDLLCDRRYETPNNLATLLGVTARTIRNDITTLSCTYPFQTIRGRYGGIQVASWYHPYRQELTPQQEVLLRKLTVSLEGEDLTVMESLLTKFVRPYRVGTCPQSAETHLET